jgi:hypothetical protein
MKIRFNLRDNNVRLVDYVLAPGEEKSMESWGGVEGLILNGPEDTFGPVLAGCVSSTLSHESGII